MPDTHVRLPDDLHKALKAAADKNERSINGEIVARLKASVKK
jgi:predicted HicB family RNase H-like nuclease